MLHPQQQCAYNASKAAVTQLAKSLAAEWAPHGIRVNCIAPGYMDTALNREALLEGQKKHWSAMTPMGRLGRPDELNGLAVFLASEASGFVTGANILADVSTFPLFSYEDLETNPWNRAGMLSIEHMRSRIKGGRMEARFT